MVGVAALALVVVGVIALRGALSSRKPPHTSTTTPTSSATRAADQRSTTTAPLLLIKIIRAPCAVFVKDSGNGNILQSDNTALPRGATLRFGRAPLQVQINDPGCAAVFVHGNKQRPPAAQPWIFSVQS
ncbi:MAG TPA: hypothetical protein VLW50_07060 [Streptosporangiaceae bacterium]|nr:hypothetical protein [Streptosporangiaceae bacterium]